MADRDIDGLLDDHDAVGLAALVADGQVTARELTDAAIARLEERNPTLNAVVATRLDAARAEADAGPTGPFGGVPFVVKDLGCDVAGLPSTRGSRLWADAVATEDSRAGPPLQGGRPDHPRQHQHAGAGQERQHRAGAPRPGPQPVAHQPFHRRIVGWIGGRGGRRHRARRPCQRRRRLDPHPRVVVRPVRAQAHPRTYAGVARPRHRHLPDGHRPRRHPHRARQRSPARRGGRTHARRPLPLPRCAARGVVRRGARRRARDAPDRIRHHVGRTAPRATRRRSPLSSAPSRSCWSSATAWRRRRRPTTRRPATMAMSTIMGAVSAVAIEDRLAELGRELGDDDLEALTRVIHEGLHQAPVTVLARAEIDPGTGEPRRRTLLRDLRPVAHPDHRAAGARARLPERHGPRVDVHPGRALRRLHRGVQRDRPARHVGAGRARCRRGCRSASSSPVGWAARPPCCASVPLLEEAMPWPQVAPGRRRPDRPVAARPAGLTSEPD